MRRPASNVENNPVATGTLVLQGTRLNPGEGYLRLLLVIPFSRKELRWEPRLKSRFDRPSQSCVVWSMMLSKLHAVCKYTRGTRVKNDQKAFYRSHFLAMIGAVEDGRTPKEEQNLRSPQPTSPGTTIERQKGMPCKQRRRHN